MVQLGYQEKFGCGVMMVSITERVRVYNPYITDTVFMIKTALFPPYKNEKRTISPHFTAHGILLFFLIGLHDRRNNVRENA